jgi:hypothetical protein
MLTPACQRLVEAAPLDRREGSVRAYVELTIYKKGHAGIGVSDVEGKNPARRIVLRDAMQLNNGEELRNVVFAIVERLENEVRISS